MRVHLRFNRQFGLWVGAVTYPNGLYCFSSHSLEDGVKEGIWYMRYRQRNANPGLRDELPVL